MSVSKERVAEMLQEEIQKVKALGIIVEPISPIVKFPKAKSFYADCHYEETVVNGKRYKAFIRVSEYYLDAPEEEIRGTLMHEILHACKEAWATGHGKKWKALAEKVNEAYGYYIKRVGSQINDGPKEYSLRRSAPAAQKTIQHKLQCQSCGHVWSRTRHSNFTLHPENYTCRCGGKIELLY